MHLQGAQRSVSSQFGMWGRTMRSVIVRVVAKCVVAFALAGCGIAQTAKIQEEVTSAKNRYDLDTAECGQKYPNRLAKPVSPRVACFSTAILKYHGVFGNTVGDPYIDLVVTMNARAAVAAEEYDAGRKTPSQYQLALATINSEYQTAVLGRQRHPGLTTVGQAQAAAAAKAIGPPTCTAQGSATPCY